MIAAAAVPVAAAAMAVAVKASRPKTPRLVNRLISPDISPSLVSRHTSRHTSRLGSSAHGGLGSGSPRPPPSWKSPAAAVTPPMTCQTQ